MLRSRTFAIALTVTALVQPAQAQTAASATALNPWDQAAKAIKDYQKQVGSALAPLYAEWQKLAAKAAEAPGGPPGSMVPASPVETLDSYRNFHVLAALPDAWRTALAAAVPQARDQGAKARGDGKPPEAPYSTFQASFAGKPRGIALPELARSGGEFNVELPFKETLGALEQAGAASGTADSEKALRDYHLKADRFCTVLGAKIRSRLRTHQVRLKAALAKGLPAAPPEWKTLPDDLREPIHYFLASHYYEGHGGLLGTSSTTGTGSGDVAGTPTEGGTGSGQAVEPGPGGTGRGDEKSEPTESGTGSGKSTPEAAKDAPGTGSGKGKAKPGSGGTGG